MKTLEPRDTYELIGHKQNEQFILKAWKKDKIPHALLLSGPRGVGKATFAFRVARFLLHARNSDQNRQNGLDFGQQSAYETLAVPKETVVSRQVANNAHPNLLVIQRSEILRTNKIRSEIVIDDLKPLKNFINLNASDGHWRIVIIDTIDEMNRNSANAILKLLEEPPKKVIFILINNSGGRLLPTIKSRCQLLKFAALSKDDLGIALQFSGVNLKESDIDIIYQLSCGSMKLAKEILSSDFLENLNDIIELISGVWPVFVADGEAIFEKWQKSIKQDPTAVLEDKILIAKNWLSNGLIQYSRSNGSYLAALKDEDELFERLINTHGIERLLGRLQDIERLVIRSKGLNLNKKETFFTFIRLLTEQENVD